MKRWPLNVTILAIIGAQSWISEGWEICQPFQHSELCKGDKEIDLFYIVTAKFNHT